MFLPRPGLAGGVFEPVTFLARPRHADDVRPTVAVAVPGVGQEIVGVILGFVRLHGTILVTHGEIWSLEPERSRHDVELPVAVEVTEIRALGIELIGEAELFEVVARRQLRGNGRWRRLERLGRHGRRARWRQHPQSWNRLAVRSHDARPGGPTAAALRDLQHEFVGAFGQPDWGLVLIRHVAAIHVVGMNDFPVQPSLHAVVGAEQQKRVGVGGRDHVRLQIRRAVVFARKKRREIHVLAARYGFPLDGLAGFFRPEWDLEHRQRPGRACFAIRPADEPILNERPVEQAELLGDLRRRRLGLGFDGRIGRGLARQAEHRLVRHVGQPGQDLALVFDAAGQLES